MQYFVYILKSEFDGRYYYGQTQDLSGRLSYHNKGYSTYTKKFRPWTVYAFSKVETRSEAIKMESKLKNLHSTKRLMDYIETNNFQKVIGPEK